MKKEGFFVGYEGYTAHFTWDENENVYVGKPEGTLYEITVKAPTTDEAIYAYCDAIDEYLNS